MIIKEQYERDEYWVHLESIIDRVEIPITVQRIAGTNGGTVSQKENPCCFKLMIRSASTCVFIKICMLTNTTMIIDIQENILKKES